MRQNFHFAAFVFYGIFTNSNQIFMKRIIYFTNVLILLSTISGFAQISLTFDNKEYSFENLTETDTLLTYSFVFCNTGQDSALIKRVESSCNVIVKYSKEPVQPDISGTIDILLDVSETIGKFNKSIYVYGDTSAIKLSITGDRIAIPTYKNEDYSAIPPAKKKDKKSTKKSNKKKRDNQ
ncbi:MAG: DUF1573 domain-containing protein [Bacteroidia bacterium]|nr:DUF1573 domain-containing protein [Bacteroidia bacterium]